MIEPPERGFTAVVWEARAAEKLADDLVTGSGTAPMAETVAAWARLGTAFGTAALDYDRIVTELRRAWRSGHSTVSLERLAVVRNWLLDAAGSATANATRVAEHIATYELARTAMPHPEEIAALTAAQQAIAQLSGMLGAPLVATADDTECRQDLVKISAARVMRTYEAASEPLATPWQQEPPPVIAPENALHSEHGAGAPPTGPPAAVAQTAGPGFSLPAVPAPRTPGAYSAPAPVQTTMTPATPATTTAAVDPGSSRMLPGPAASAATTVPSSEDRSSRAAGATAPYLADPADLALRIQAAPAVVGAAEPGTGTRHDPAHDGIRP